MHAQAHTHAFTHARTQVCMHAHTHTREIYSPYLSTHTVYLSKKFKNHYFGGVRPYWKMDTGKHKFHEILLCKTEQKD